jgi:hypothetical protein
MFYSLPSSFVSKLSVTFEAGSQLREIKDWAFFGCESLWSIHIPASVELLDDRV